MIIEIPKGDNIQLKIRLGQEAHDCLSIYGSRNPQGHLTLLVQLNSGDPNHTSSKHLLAVITGDGPELSWETFQG